MLTVRVHVVFDLNTHLQLNIVRGCSRGQDVGTGRALPAMHKLSHHNDCD